MAEYVRLDPKIDAIFKLLFSSDEEVLIALLTAVLEPSRPITAALVTNPELLGDFSDDKSAFLDIAVTLDDGTRVDIEMQSFRLSTLRPRSVFYLSRLLAGQLSRGQGHGELRPVISILFLNFIDLRKGPFHQRFCFRSGETHEVFSDLMEIHTVELPKVGVFDETPLGRWCRYLTTEDRTEVERLERSDVMIEKTEARLVRLSSDEIARELAETRARREFADSLERGHHYREGRRAGLAEGQTAGKRELVRKVLIAKSAPKEVIESVDVATEKDLEALLERFL